jgi:predicted N-acetyltransferase YhbS
MDITAPRPGEDLDALAELFAHAFGDFWQWRDAGANSYFSHGPYDWEASRVGFIDGQVATHFGIWDFTMRIGCATVRVAGVGAVATARAYQRQGLMHETARQCVDALRAAGYDMSLLFGIPGFYGTFGYASTFPQATPSIRTESVAIDESAVEYEPYAGDIAALAPLYNSENEGVTGTFIRPTFTDPRRRAHMSVYTFDGGYIVAGPRNGRLEVADSVGPPERILSVAARLARHHIMPEIAFVFLPRRSRLARYLAGRDHRWTAAYSPDGGAMVRIVNLESTVTRIAGELERRLAGTLLANYSGQLTLRGDNEAVELLFERGSVAGVKPRAAASEAASEGTKLPGQGLTGRGVISAGAALARLVIGDDEPGRVCEQTGIQAEGDAAHLLPVLFPEQEPSIVLWDRF